QVVVDRGRGHALSVRTRCRAPWGGSGACTRGSGHACTSPQECTGRAGRTRAAAPSGAGEGEPEQRAVQRDEECAAHDAERGGPPAVALAAERASLRREHDERDEREW